MDRARHALALAAGGASVAVVSSGDPGIFAMATAVLEAVESGNGEYADVDLRVVPGLSAMHAAAARVGAPLGHDFAVISLSDQRKPWSIIERRLEAAGAADFALALYNPASKTRREQLERAREVLLRHRSAGLPGRRRARRRRGGRGGRRSRRWAASTPTRVDMRTLLVIGSTTTRVIERARRPRARLHAAFVSGVIVLEPGERLLDGLHRLAVRSRRARDDDHRQPALARRGELGLRHLAAGVLRDEHVERVAVDQGELAVDA